MSACSRKSTAIGVLNENQFYRRGRICSFGGAVGLFLIRNRHKAFAHHVDFFTKLNDVNGISPGSDVRVSGFRSRPSQQY
jgi:hypothetical protein